MSMFHICKFPIYEGGGIVETDFVIRDGVFEDILHDFVSSGTHLLVEDWSADDCVDIVLCKRGCVWVKTDDNEGPSRLPDEYYRAVNTVKENMAYRLRSHPFM